MGCSRRSGWRIRVSVSFCRRVLGLKHGSKQEQCAQGLSADIAPPVWTAIRGGGSFGTRSRSSFGLAMVAAGHSSQAKGETALVFSRAFSRAKCGTRRRAAAFEGGGTSDSVHSRSGARSGQREARTLYRGPNPRAGPSPARSRSEGAWTSASDRTMKYAENVLIRGICSFENVSAKS